MYIYVFMKGGRHLNESGNFSKVFQVVDVATLIAQHIVSKCCVYMYEICICVYIYVYEGGGHLNESGNFSTIVHCGALVV